MRLFKVNLILITSIFLWASAFVGIRIALEGYSPGPLALFRFLVASVCMAFIYHNQKETIYMPWRDRVQLLIAGMAGIGIYNICLNYGEISVSAGVASFIIGLMPASTVLLSFIILKEKLNAGVWMGVLISLFGLFLIALGEGTHASMRQGILLILISAFMGSVLTIMKKRLLKIYSPIAIISWIMWGGTLLLLMFFPGLIKEFPIANHQATIAVVYMGIFPAAIAYLAWGYVLKNMSASQASLSLYALPLASTLLGFIILNEEPSFISLVGGTVAVIGAFIANRFQIPTVLEGSPSKKVVAV